MLRRNRGPPWFCGDVYVALGQPDMFGINELALKLHITTHAPK